MSDIHPEPIVTTVNPLKQMPAPEGKKQRRKNLTLEEKEKELKMALELVASKKREKRRSLITAAVGVLRSIEHFDQTKELVAVVQGLEKMAAEIKP